MQKDGAACHQQQAPPRHRSPQRPRVRGGINRSGKRSCGERWMAAENACEERRTVTAEQCGMKKKVEGMCRQTGNALPRVKREGGA